MNERKSNLDYEIGRRVSEALRKRGLKRKPFAERIGIDDGQFRRLLNGTNRWNTWHIDAVAKGIDIHPAELLGAKVSEISKRRLVEDIEPVPGLSLYVNKEELFMVHMFVFLLRMLKTDRGSFDELVSSNLDFLREMFKSLNIRFCEKISLDRRVEDASISFSDRRQSNTF